MAAELREVMVEVTEKRTSERLHEPGVGLAPDPCASQKMGL
jgi:hypothetical protein